MQISNTLRNSVIRFRPPRTYDLCMFRLHRYMIACSSLNYRHPALHTVLVQGTFAHSTAQWYSIAVIHYSAETLRAACSIHKISCTMYISLLPTVTSANDISRFGDVVCVYARILSNSNSMGVHLHRFSDSHFSFRSFSRNNVVQDDRNDYR